MDVILCVILKARTLMSRENDIKKLKNSLNVAIQRYMPNYKFKKGFIDWFAVKLFLGKRYDENFTYTRSYNHE